MIHPLSLKLFPVFKHLNDSHYFNVTVKVMDHESEMIESTRGVYSVSLYTIPEVDLYGDTNQICTLGICRFVGISAMKEGKFRFAAHLTEMKTLKNPALGGVSDEFFIVSKEIAHPYLNQIQILMSDEVAEFSLFEFFVLLIDINGAILNETRFVVVNGGMGYIGPESITVVNGKGLVEAYFNQSGEGIIQVCVLDNCGNKSYKVRSKINLAMLIFKILILGYVLATIASALFMIR